MLATSATLVLPLGETKARFVRRATTALPVLYCPSDALKHYTTLVLVQLMFPTVNLAKPVTTAWIMTVFLEFAPRDISAVKRPKSQFLVPKELTTLTRSRSILKIVSHVLLVLRAM
jgi:hypothetical protein